MQDLAILARKILARLAYFLQDGFYWDIFLKRLARSCIKSCTYVSCTKK